MNTVPVLLAVLVLALTAVWIYSLAHRLDRLHVRTDSAWLALESALGRRAAVVRVVMRATGTDASDLAVLADRAERAERDEREAAENTFSAALNGRRRPLPGQLAAELADAEARVQIARRFHNDAVRDTLALRGRRPVRWLRLGGTAPLPLYFEIAERPLPLVAPPRPRPSARVVLLDTRDRALLLRGCMPEDPDVRFWFTPGGALEEGEDARGAVVREVAEETGLTLAAEQLCGPVWERRTVFALDGEEVESQETYYVASVADFVPTTDGFTQLERRTITDARWCSPVDIAALAAGDETVYPPGLATLLPEASDVAHSRTGAAVRTIS